MTNDAKKIIFDKRIFIVGCGSISQAILPLLFDRLTITPDRIKIVSADNRGEKVAKKYKVEHIINPITEENYNEILSSHVSRGDFLLNLSVNVSSFALMEWCHKNGVLYIDTCIEPWEGFYVDPALTPEQRSNYALRERALELRKKLGKGPTAVMAHGANPGLVSHFVKQALLNVAKDTGLERETPKTQEEWGKLMQDLGIKTVHIAERDTQVSKTPKKGGEFVNTWSVDGFVSEGLQPGEMGWGTHEKKLPPDGKQHTFGCDSAIFLDRPGMTVRVRSFTPHEGPYHGFLITHNESISIADYFSLRDGGKVTFRPTVHYAYHPCDDAVISLHEILGKNFVQQPTQRILMDDVSSGVDELGVLLMGHAKNSYWFGSTLSITTARNLIPHNNATSLQVVAGVLGAMMWAIENPEQGIMEADEIDFKYVLGVAKPYLGKVTGSYSNWTPIENRGTLFKEDLDTEDPWQFSNFRVV